MDDDSLSEHKKRQNERVRLDLPIQARVGAGDQMVLEIVDISATGMQVRTENFDVLKDGFDSQHNQATFEITCPITIAFLYFKVIFDIH